MGVIIITDEAQYIIQLAVQVIIWNLEFKKDIPIIMVSNLKAIPYENH